MFRSTVVGVLLLVGGAGAASAQDAARGEAVYAAQQCSLCHSVAGKGNSKGMLDSVGTRLNPDAIRAWITDSKGMTSKTGATRKPEMKAYSLPKADVENLVAYLQTLKK